MVPHCEERAAGLGSRVSSLDWVVKDGFLEEVPLEPKRKEERSRTSCVSWAGPVFVFDSS